MKNTLLILCAFFFSLSAARAQFEGVIDMKMTMTVEGAPREMMYSMSVKKDMMAADVKGTGEEMQGGKFIFRGDKKALWIVNDAQKSYIEISLNDSDKSKKPGESDEAEDPEVTLHKTGKTQTILGYSCEEWVAEDRSTVSNIWGTTRLGNIYEGLSKSFGEMGGMGKLHRGGGWESKLADMKVFPLKIVTSKDGQEQQTQEVTRIQKKSIASSVFDTPAGYEKQSLDLDMGKMMKDLQEQLRHRAQERGDSGDGKIDVDKMMKQMQEKMKEMKEEKSDSSNE
jgi:hypothetical protein